MNILQTPVPDNIILEMNGTSSLYSYSNNVLVGEKLYLVLSVLLPSGTGNISATIGQRRNSLSCSSSNQLVCLSRYH